MKYLLAISSRYGALAIQFLIVILITRFLPQEKTGIYFVLFGIIQSTFFASGLGIPDGIVKVIPEFIAANRVDLVRPYLIKSCKTMLLINIIESAILFCYLLFNKFNISLVIATLLWWLSYAITFFVAQALVAIRKEAAGSFFFYTAINCSLVFTVVPYVFLVHTTTLEGVLWMTVIGSSLSTIASAYYFFFNFQKLNHSIGNTINGNTINKKNGNTINKKIELAPAMKLGIVIASSRILQSIVVWIPLWLSNYYLGSQQASLLGLAGRLVVAVGAILAALRFSIRPTIVTAAAHGEWQEIQTLGRSIAFLATSLALMALIGTLILGPFVIPAVFGYAYIQSVPLIAILLIGSIGESFGGPVDEVLKMTGHPHIVLWTLVGSMIFQLCFCYLLHGIGIKAFALAQALSFCFIYTTLIIFTRRVTGVTLFPSLNYKMVLEVFIKKFKKKMPV